MPLSAHIRCSSWWLQKNGNIPEEYEDAVAFAPGIGRFAIADGATESGFAANWAQTLVQCFVQNELRSDNESEWLADARSRWLAETSELPSSWYAELKRDEGAAGTLVGLKLLDSKQPAALRWEASVVGDSCLFQLRNDDLLLAFPITDPDGFDNTPQLVCSRPRAPGAASGFQSCSGEFHAGDTIILATDALAQWFLREKAAGHCPWSELLVYAGARDDELMMAASEDWMSGLRESKAIRNDDVTMLVINL